MTDETKTSDEDAHDDMDLFDADDDSLVEAARHLRTCKKCRPRLLAESRDKAKFVLAEVELEVGRSLERDEKRLLAKAMLIRESMSMAQMMKFAEHAIEAVGDVLMNAQAEMTSVGDA